MNIDFQRLIAAGFLAASVGGFLTACNTVEGAGKDIEAAGDEIQEEATEAKN